MKTLSEIPNILLKLYILHRTSPVIKEILLKKYNSPFGYYKCNSQVGGRTITIDYNNEQFSFVEFDTNFWSLRSPDNNYDCVIIGIDTEHNVAAICNINADTVMCGHTILTNQGSHLLRIALQFLRENKARLNINRIQLTDTATISCPGNRKIRLDMFLTLLTGETWYGKHGFRPVDKKCRDEYRYNRNIMSTTKIQDIGFDSILTKRKDRLTEEQYNYLHKKYNEIKETDVLVKDFLKHVFRKTKYKMMCSVFNYIWVDLASGLNLHLLGPKELYELKI